MDNELHQNPNEESTAEKPEANKFPAEKMGQKTFGKEGQMVDVCNQMEKENATDARRVPIEMH